MDTIIEHIFICCGEVLISQEDSAECSACERNMENAGWMETGGIVREDVDNTISKV